MLEVALAAGKADHVTTTILIMLGKVMFFAANMKYKFVTL
jgi:hypothetical protein